ncbi:hypothetical protein CfE428DRAFT_0696 [Chthoniobacter flavus Ellin428]|uniref:Uncharacterized protein n=1 Tax=Chthoniobacter flavus Ellin428 TaxID=497964 RepID=B4CVK9_9BACT|nr:DUF4175 family protein [Chthoniobacter flavus]EDY21451.1 hypothetical protein CfE428DRAFT_0696 [Chthoniobacter flavus Ellin428]TCO95407.1 hypothetical protein EV701_10194 [Chthoniobacter flavus]
MPELLTPASTKIDPLILRKLQAFADRRRKLIVRRGIYAAVATLLVAMMVVAAIDYIFVLPDALRWTFSGAAYLAIIIVEWRSCWRLLLKAPGSRQLARLVEHAEPKLREDLLSAVELGDEGPNQVFDSEQFRALVQSDVAARVEKLDMEELLPAKLLRRYSMIAAGIGVACLVAFTLTGFQFGTLMMRALLPMANFARVSKVKVKIVEPFPAEMRVAQGDTLPLIIELSGQSMNKATLETFTPSGGREVVPMTPLARDRFSATIQVGRENVYYRVRAGDALTKKYLLEAVARPAVVDFQKAYTYPSYSKLEPKTVTEENGDLSALEGSQVLLRLHTNQKVKDAELRIEQGKKNTVVPLVTQGDALVAKLPIDASGIYRVHLVGADSGFENKFSPEYELRAEPDLVPQVTLDLPKQDLILPSNEIVDVQGSASDDFALAKVSQMVKINDGNWKETVLSKEPGAKTQVERRWDLFDQGVKPGDLVTTKLVAVDLKGNRAESRPLQVTITAAGFETKRLQALNAYKQLLEVIKAAETASAALVKQTNDARQQFDRLGEGDPQRKQVLMPVSASITDLLQKNSDVMKQLATVLRDATPGHESGDLAFIGRALSREQTYGVEKARGLVEVLSANPALPTAHDLLGEALNSIGRTEQILRQATDSCRTTLNAEEIDVLNENLQVVDVEQQRLLTLAHQSGTSAEKWAPVANRLRVVLAELRGLEELSGGAADHGIRAVADRMRNIQKLINKRRTALETALGGPLGAELLGPTMELSQAVTDVSHQALDMARDMRGQTMAMLRVMTREVEATHSSFEQLRAENERLVRNDKLPVEVANVLLDGRWAAHLDAWKLRGDIEEWRPDADSYFVNDMRLTTRVLQALRDRVAGERSEKWAKDLHDIELNFRVLECGHLLTELVGQVEHLSTEERWEIYNAKSRTTSPHDWAWLSERLRTTPEEVGRALDFPERRPLGQAVQKILWDAQNQEFTHQLQREMDDRFNISRMPVTAKDQADQLADYLRQALDLLREPMEQSRESLSKLTPSLAQTMKQLAKKTEELRDKTSNQAQQVSEKLTDEAKADARQALADQQRLNQQVESLKDALRADANQQDILSKEGRERARDADDAVAMLREPPQRAQEDLELAAKSDKSQTQEQALNQAVEQQQKLTQALQQMSEHYAALDAGKPEDTRQAMRATEQANGVKDQLDQDYAKAEQMAKLAQSTPEEMLKQLEKALPQNPQMQKELSGISQNALKGAAEQLKQASAQENNVAQSVQKMAKDEQAQAEAAALVAKQNAAQAQAQAQANPANAQSNPPNNANPANAQQPNGQQQQANAQSPQNGQQGNPQQQAQQPGQANPQNQQPNQNNAALAQDAKEQTPIGKTAEQAADDVMRAGRHEMRLENKVAGEQLDRLGKQIEANAQQQVPNAQQSLQKAQQAMQAQPAVNDANTGLQKSLQKLNAMANPAQAEADAAAEGQPNKPAAAQQADAAGQQAQAAQMPNQAAQAAPQSGQQQANAQQGNTPQATGKQAHMDQASGQEAMQSQTAQTGAKGQPKGPQGSAAEAQNSQAAQNGQTQQAPQEAEPNAMTAATPASPQEQVWMARTLDALDAALHAHAGDEEQEGKNGGQQQQAGQNNQGAQQAANQQAQQQRSQNAQQASAAGGKPSQQSSAAAKAQAAMAQAAASAAKSARSETGSPNQSGEPQQGSLQAMSKGGAQAQGANGPHGTLGDAKLKAGDWGKLPKQMAEQLTQGQQEGIAGEYRNQVETYYRVIAEKSKKP